MQLPKLILGLAIVFWGWQTNFWLFALPMTLFLEMSLLINWRWHFTTAHFRQISHLCTILLVLIIVYVWNQEEGSLKFIFIFLRWLPCLFFPLLIAQTYSDSKGINIQALLFFKDKPQTVKQKNNILDLSYPFLAICLISASFGIIRDGSFYLGLVTLSAIALWFKRSSRTSAFTWISLMLLTVIIGFFTHLSLHNAHLALEKKAFAWLRHFYHYQSSNPNQINTAIGDIGALKFTNKIILRVKPEAYSIEPDKLRKAAYNNYVSGMWVAKKAEFQPLSFQSNTVTVNSQKQLSLPNNQLINNSLATVNIYQDLEEGQNLLNLPDGSQKITNLPVEKVEQNQYGAVQVTSEPRLAAYQVTYQTKQINDEPPSLADLVIPRSEQTAIQQIVTELNLREKSPEEIINTVHTFFNTEFTYSLKLARQRKFKTPLADFLLDNRSGHCEYFATATALLLREVGIPTRYVVGYNVHEYSNLEQKFIVRERNAHAWNLVYLNGNWQVIDNTPADWISFEDNAASQLAIITDILSWIKFKIAQFNELIKVLSQTKSFWLIIIPLVAILIWWLLRKRNVNGLQLQRVKPTINNYMIRGQDSEIYLIEQTLQESGLTRNTYESWQKWLIRLEGKTQLNDDLIQELRNIIRLHYCYRFDPQGINSADRKHLKLISQSWIKKYQQSLKQ